MHEILGRKAKDSVTGFSGTITAKVEYLYRPTEVCIEGLTGNSGSPQQMWVEIDRAEITD